MNRPVDIARTYPDVRRRDWFVFCVVVAFPIIILDLRLPVPGVKVRVSDFYIIGLFGYFILFKPNALRWTISCLQWFVPFLVYLALSSLFRLNFSGIVELIQWCLILIWIPLFSYALRDRPEHALRLLLAGFATVAVAVALYHVSIGYVTSYKQLGDARFAFGLFALTAITTAFWRKSVGLALLILLALILLFLSDERKGILISFLAILMAWPVLKLNRYFSFAGPFAVVVFLASLVSGFILVYLGVRDSPDLIYFLDEEFARWDSNTHRANLLANGVDIFTNNPWFGVGGKGLREHMMMYYLNSGLAIYTHNWYLDMWVEYGAVGAALYAFAVIPVIGRVSRTPVHGMATLYPLVLYCLLVPIFMHNGTTSTFIVVTCFAIAHVIRRDVRHG